ncbi:MAG: GNAT family N-acetyltransferase [Lysobacter sp.]
MLSVRHDTCRSTRNPGRSIAILASDGDKLVGASLGLPVADARESFRLAFAAAGREVDRAFQLGGSVVLPTYRGRGLAHRFFDERESHARALGGFELTTLQMVERAADDPRLPPFGRSFEPFLRKRATAPTTGSPPRPNGTSSASGR